MHCNRRKRAGTPYAGAGSTPGKCKARVQMKLLGRGWLAGWLAQQEGAPAPAQCKSAGCWDACIVSWSVSVGSYSKGTMGRPTSTVAVTNQATAHRLATGWLAGRLKGPLKSPPSTLKRCLQLRLAGRQHGMPPFALPLCCLLRRLARPARPACSHSPCHPWKAFRSLQGEAEGSKRGPEPCARYSKIT